jgi:DNA-binding FrmR family transcriptional regulator
MRLEAETKTQLMQRLKTIEGHTRGLQRMVDSEQYCIDIVRQVRAVQRALDKISGLLLENHLETCVATAMSSDRKSEQERVIQELVYLLAGPVIIDLPHPAARLNEVGSQDIKDTFMQVIEDKE